MLDWLFKKKKMVREMDGEAFFDSDEDSDAGADDAGPTDAGSDDAGADGGDADD